MAAHNVNVLDATDLHVQNDLNGKFHVCFATIFKKIKGEGQTVHEVGGKHTSKTVHCWG